MKKALGDIIILHICTKNYGQVLYGSWDMVCERQTDWQKKWHIEVGAPPNNSKTHCYALKTFCNWKKIPLIPPLLLSNCLIPDFKAKANLFNDFFGSQCTPLENNILNSLVYFTDTKIDFVANSVTVILLK